MLMVFIAVCGFLAFFTNGFTSSLKTFYVEIEDKQILSTAENYELTTTVPLNVEVKYVFKALSSENSGYFVKVLPSIIADKDFDFTIDGSVYSYQAEEDLTAGFDIDYGETSFTIKPKGGITEILSAVYPNMEVGVSKDKAYENMFTLVVTSYNGEENIRICFSVLEKVSSVILDQEVIIF